MTHRLLTASTVCLTAGSLIVGALTLAGCGANDEFGPASASGDLATAHYTIVTTCGMVTDIVREVVGERATVNGLMGEGVDPHLYKPIRSDVVQLTKADVIFYSGLMLEGRMSDLFLRASRDGKQIYAVTEGIDESYLREPPEFEGHFDPHVWMDVTAWSECVAFVATALGEYDPPYAATYQENAERYRQQLAELDDYIRQAIASIPTDQRVLITAHDAFGYFGRAYEIEVRSVQGLSTESAASVDDINRLVDFIVSRKLQAIFVESSVSEKNIQAIIEGAEHKGVKVAIGGSLYSDAMGAPGSYEGTYIGMMDHNATVIAGALGGSVPKSGWQSKLKP